MMAATSTNESQNTQRYAKGDSALLGRGGHSAGRRLARARRRPLGVWLATPHGSRAAGGSPTPSHHDQDARVLELTFDLMSTRAGIWLESSEAAAGLALRHARRLLESVEARFSRFRPDSELCRLNNAAGGGPVAVSGWLLEAVAAALELARLSDGLVDPTVLPGLVRAGYGPGCEEGPIDYRRVHLDRSGQRIRLETGVALDLGGVAKGWAADRVAQALAPYGSVLVEVGGDLAARGSRVWRLGVEDPFHPEGDLEVIDLLEGGVATSSILKRSWTGGHHLIDPRTGCPARTDLVAATVLAPTATQAEAGAKTAILLGEHEAPRFLEKAGFSAILVRDDGSVRKVGAA